MLQKFLLSTQQNIRRFHALIATPLFMMSALSNFYFFAGMSIGNQFVIRLFEGMRFTYIMLPLATEYRDDNTIEGIWSCTLVGQSFTGLFTAVQYCSSAFSTVYCSTFYAVYVNVLTTHTLYLHQVYIRGGESDYSCVNKCCHDHL